LKVAFLTSKLSRHGGGVFEVVCSLSKALTAADVEVKLFGLWDEDTGADLGERNVGVTFADKPLGPGTFGYSRGLAKALDEYDPDLVHTHGLWQYTSIAGRDFARRKNVPLVVSPHGMLDPWALRNSGWKKSLAGLAFENSHLEGCSCLHAIAAGEARSIRKRRLKAPVCVIPNGVDLPSGVSEEALSRGPEIQSESIRLLFLGRLHPKKGLEALVRGWALFRNDLGSRALNWDLSIAGWDQNGHEGELQRIAEELEVGDSVTFPGPLFGPEKQRAFLHATAFVLPSHSEGLPVAVLEAWSFGLPVLMTPECNIPEGFESGSAVRIEATPEAVLEGLLELERMGYEERRRMGERGLELVSSRFTWPRVAGQMHEVYSWLLRGGEPPPSVALA